MKDPSHSVEGKWIIVSSAPDSWTSEDRGRLSGATTINKCTIVVFIFKWFWNQIGANKTFVDHRGNYFFFITSMLPSFSISPLTKQFAAQSEDSDLPRKGCTLQLFTCNTDLWCTLGWTLSATTHFISGFFPRLKGFVAVDIPKGFISVCWTLSKGYRQIFMTHHVWGSVTDTWWGTPVHFKDGWCWLMD